MNFEIKDNTKIGLALGGGAVLGAAHIGVLKALDELNIPVHCVAGTSIGAFIGAFVAFDKSWEEIQDFTVGLNWLNVTSIQLSKFGLLSNKKIKDVLERSIGKVDFNQAGKELTMIAADLVTGEKITITNGNVGEGVMASTCIPGVFTPVERDGRLLIDGGIVENVPVSPLKEMGADKIIAVDLNAWLAREKPANIIEVLLYSFEHSLRTATRLQTIEADITITPDMSDFSKTNTDQVEEMIEIGYLAAKGAIK